MIKIKDILSEKFDSNFASWFNGSVVVDSSGNPMRMYHGTHAKENFSIFNTELRGAWFTANPKEAAAYAGGGDASAFKKYGRTIPVFLNIKNPKKFTLDEFERLIDTWVRNNSYKKEMVNLKKQSIADGHDGLYLQGSSRERDIYVAFYPTQIKNAITLNELDYPMAGKEDLQSYGGMAGWKGKIVYMSPDKFLRLAAPLPDWAINKESLKKIEDRMKGQLPLDFCVLEVDMNTRKVTGHEGRHRCIAAKKLGIEKVPVLIFTGSSFARVPQWDQSTHDVVDKADFKPQLKETDVSTFKLYHGGSRWSYLPDDIQPGKKNRYEAGVGIYFTNSYNTARKYAKGNKVVHLVEIDRQFKDIDNVNISIDKITEFVKNVPQLSSKKEIINDLNSYATRVGKKEIPLSILNNLVVNYQAARGSSGVHIAKFFTECGADGHVQKQSGDEIWLVVFNPKILKSVKVVNPKEINSDSQFMLPIRLMEKHDRSTISTRIIKATEFFKNKLNIGKTPVKVNVISLTKDDGEIRYDFNINSHVINISSNVNEDRQIRALAHELTHLQQIVSGRLDYNNKKWLGKSYVGVDYKIQPWESEARTSAAELWVEFNRSVRDGKIKL